MRFRLLVLTLPFRSLSVCLTVSLSVYQSSYASPHLWNQLPSSFRQPHSVHSPPGSPHPGHITSSQYLSELPPSISPSIFHSRLKTHHSLSQIHSHGSIFLLSIFIHSHSYSFRTAFTGLKPVLNEDSAMATMESLQENNIDLSNATISDPYNLSFPNMAVPGIASRRVLPPEAYNRSYRHGSCVVCRTGFGSNYVAFCKITLTFVIMLQMNCFM